MNKFEKALERIKKNAEPQDSWTEEDWEHYKTIIKALEIASGLTQIDIHQTISKKEVNTYENEGSERQGQPEEG